MKVNKIAWMPEPVEVLTKWIDINYNDSIQIQYWHKREDGYAGYSLEECPICMIGHSVDMCLVDFVGVDHTYCKYSCGSLIASFRDGTIAAAYVSDRCYEVMTFMGTKQEDLI